MQCNCYNSLVVEGNYGEKSYMILIDIILIETLKLWIVYELWWVLNMLFNIRSLLLREK